MIYNLKQGYKILLINFFTKHLKKENSWSIKNYFRVYLPVFSLLKATAI